MCTYRNLAWALVACACLGGAPGAAQELVLTEESEAKSQAASSSATAQPTQAPPRPTGLRSKALSNFEAILAWKDNSGNEQEFRVETRWGSEPWTDLGALPANADSVYVVGLIPGTTYYFRIRARNAAGPSAYSNETAATSFFERASPCAPGDGDLCLGGGRYRVTARYEGEKDLRGDARGVALTEDSGFFWFFSPSNVEAVLKILDGCSVNQRRWVFTTGLTNLRVLLVVIDTHTGATSTYLNERGSPFAPVQDTDAFATCS